MDEWVDDDDDYKMSGGKGKGGKAKLSNFVDQQKVMDIVNLGMGFTMQQIQNAILKTDNGTAEAVVNYILENPNAHEQPNYVPSKVKNDEPGGDDGISGIGDDNKEDDFDENTVKRNLEKKKQQKERRKKMFALGPAPRLTRTASDSAIHKISGHSEALEAIGLMFEHNFFIIILQYILKQLLNSTQNCMICGEQLEYPGLKPTICLSPFCQFRLLEIGLGGGSDGGYGFDVESSVESGQVTQTAMISFVILGLIMTILSMMTLWLVIGFIVNLCQCDLVSEIVASSGRAISV